MMILSPFRIASCVLFMPTQFPRRNENKLEHVSRLKNFVLRRYSTASNGGPTRDLRFLELGDR